MRSRKRGRRRSARDTRDTGATGTGSFRPRSHARRLLAVCSLLPASALPLLFYSFTTASLLLYYFFTTALLLLYYCVTRCVGVLRGHSGRIVSVAVGGCMDRLIVSTDSAGEILFWADGGVAVQRAAETGAQGLGLEGLEAQSGSMLFGQRTVEFRCSSPPPRMHSPHSP